MSDFLSSSLGPQLAAVGAVGVLILWCLVFPRSRQPCPNYPPGPPKHPLWGNWKDIPVTMSWVAYNKMAKKYGDIVHLEVFGDQILLLSSFETVRDLVERRSSIYSDRPVIRMLSLMGWDWTTALKPYGPQWQHDRKIFMQQFGASATTAYRPIQIKVIHKMLYDLLTTPQDATKHYKTASVGSVLSIMYGYDTASIDERLVSLSENTVQRLSLSAFPNKNAVNIFAPLRYIPQWFPGAGFKRYANETSDMVRRMVEIPLQFVQNNTTVGIGSHSLVSDLLANSQSEEERRAITGFAATSYSGADATSSALGTFFLAMATYPDIQRKAQLEIDTVIGSDRLATFEDRRSLPYFEAVFREVLRWKPVFPLGIPHLTIKDDFYRGYFIPKGTTVITNVLALLHNPERYPNTEAFYPDRYFDEDGNLNSDEVPHAFGFGRRICPGRHLATDTIWLVIACVLATFNIAKKKDASENDIPIDGEYSDGIIVHPLPFEYSVTPRSAEAAQVILDVAGRDNA